MKDKSFTHIDSVGNPTMVDVSEKKITKRLARAQAIVHVTKEIINQIQENELLTKKGPVFQTAILAGVMGAKKTSDLIPLCHPLSIEDCKITIRVNKQTIVISSSVVITSKTGAEMEALTAVSIAALTIYDMCKALSHEIRITEIQLIEKTGGKEDFKRIE
jgi:cyclic pyranopterin monophosphate synthase